MNSSSLPAGGAIQKSMKWFKKINWSGRPLFQFLFSKWIMFRKIIKFQKIEEISHVPIHGKLDSTFGHKVGLLRGSRKMTYDPKSIGKIDGWFCVPNLDICL